MTQPTRCLRDILPLYLILCAGGLGFAQAPKTREQPNDDERRADMFKRFPQSDTNKDGTLSREEALAFFRQRREGTAEARKAPSRKIEPTHADVRYGDHAKQAFDIWLVPGATKPTPLVLFIHGGGFRSGDKSALPPTFIDQCLKAGVAFAAMNYRLSDVGPYPMMMQDCARGLQMIRHRAAEWNLNPERIACYGGSAGAGISLWLGFHEDLADPVSADPIARQSTRVVAVGTMNGQTTYDLRDFREWFALPNLEPGPALPSFYDVKSPDDWESDRVKQLMTEASSIHHLTKNDVPVYMIYSRPNTPITAETGSSEWVHHVKLGLKLQEAMKKLGLESIVTAPDVKPENDFYGSMEDFLIQKVKG